MRALIEPVADGMDRRQHGAIATGSASFDALVTDHAKLDHAVRDVLRGRGSDYLNILSALFLTSRGIPCDSLHRIADGSCFLPRMTLSVARVPRMKISRSIAEPLRIAPSWEERWEGPDKGLILCWETGREKREAMPELAQRASDGQLIPLPWRGGLEKAIKAKEKYGSLFYLAMWQGLRADDLEIDTERGATLVCTATGQKVVFTADSAKFNDE